MGGARLYRAVTIEPFEVSLWRGGCGGLLWDFNQPESVVASRCGRFGAGAVGFGWACGWERRAGREGSRHGCGSKLVKKPLGGVACGNTHEPGDRDGVRAGHRAQVLGAGSGTVERTRRLPDGYQSVAQFSNRDVLNHPHGTGAEGTRRLAGSSGGPIDAWLHAEQRAAALERSGAAAVGEEAEVADADQAFG